MQERVYPKFGMFPWECAQCRQIFLLKSRGHSYRKAGPRSGAETSINPRDKAEPDNV